MKILTLAILVPDSRSPITIAPDGTGINPAGVKFVCNPFDEFAIEQAVQLKERRSDVEEIVALTIGGDSASQALRTALALGADRGIHVQHPNLPLHDEILLARLLAEAVKLEKHPFDLILTGKQSIDNDAGVLGPALAEFLHLPHIGAIVKLDLAADGASLRAHRRIEGAEEIIESPLPILLTCDKGLVEPRIPSLPNLMKAKKKPLTTRTAADLPLLNECNSGLHLRALSPPPPRPECTMIEGEPEVMARELVRRLREEAQVI